MSAGLDGTFAIVLDLAAPKNGFAFFVGRLQFEPDIEGINGAAGEKMADLARSNDHVHANIIAAANGSARAIDGSGDRANFTCRTFWQRGLGFFTHGESRRELLLAHFVANRRAGRLPGR